MKKTNKLMALVAMALGLVFASCQKEEGVASYTLTVKPNNAAWGSVTGSGTYSGGDRVDVEAVAALGYFFIRWSDGAASNPRTVTVGRDMTLYALFSSRQNDPDPYNPGATSTPGAGAVPEGYVDLGLPSGLLWATCNIGASSPEEYGDYYAWGETETKEIYSWSTYKYCTVNNEGNLRRLTKYNLKSDMGNVDNLSTLLELDDVACVKLGDGARMPTIDEWRELKNNTNCEKTTQNGVYGLRLTAANGRSLFLPAAGYYDIVLVDAGASGFYWSSSLDSVDSRKAWYFSYDDDPAALYSYNRTDGQSVRAVRPTR